MSDIKRIDIKEFRERGYLQEANRQFFHPLGLALEVVTDKETGEESLGGVWDYRSDSEGMAYADSVLLKDDAKQKAENVKQEYEEKAKARKAELGYVVQPIEGRG